MPTAIELPNYDDTWLSIKPTLSTNNAAKAQGPIVNVQGTLDVNSTVTVTNASDYEFALANHYIGCWQFLDIPATINTSVVVTGFYSPLKTVHSRIIVDEFGFSELALRWNVDAICYVATPGLGWQRPIAIDSLIDNNFRNHVVPNTVGAPRGGAFTAKWTLPSGTKYPKGLNVFIGLSMSHRVVSNDVTVTSVVQTKGTLNFISAKY